MCKHGDSVYHELTTPSLETVDRVTGETFVWPERRRVEPLDRCIAPLVVALQAAGILTRGSCCGHDKFLGSIKLADGRELIIVPKLGATPAAVWESITPAPDRTTAEA